MSTQPLANQFAPNSVQGVWRQRHHGLLGSLEFLVIDADRARLPPRCIWSGVDEEIEYKPTTFTYKDGIRVRGVISAAVNAVIPTTTATVAIPISKAHIRNQADAQWTVAIWMRWIALALCLIGYGGGPAAASVMSAMQVPTATPNPVVIGGMIVGSLGFVLGIIGLAFPYLSITDLFKGSQSSQEARSIEGRIITLADVHPDFLKLVPELPSPNLGPSEPTAHRNQNLAD